MCHTFCAFRASKAGVIASGSIIKMSNNSSTSCLQSGSLQGTPNVDFYTGTGGSYQGDDSSTTYTLCHYGDNSAMGMHLAEVDE